jgi:hypothetical protein
MLLRYADLPVTGAFGLRPSDVVTLNDQMRFGFRGGEARLFDHNGRYLGSLPDTPVDLLKRFLTAIDGRRSLGAICSEQPFAEHAGNFQALVEAMLGGPFLIPATIDTLEKQLPAVEILRFPTQSPYAMPREYWENSLAVRQALDRLYASLNDFAAFCIGLRGLHRLATIGASGSNYYGGAGSVVTVPGEFRSTPIGNRFDERRKRLFNDWLRQLDVTDLMVENGTIISTNHVPLVAITDHGLECRHPYGPSGEQLASQLNEIRVQLAEARATLGPDRARFLRHCALFHHAFVHAHPFANINNSIAMNIVNDLLGGAEIGVLPHLYFDQVAYFLQPEDYVRVFERGVDAHVINDALGRNRPATAALLDVVASVQP